MTSTCAQRHAVAHPSARARLLVVAPNTAESVEETGARVPLVRRDERGAQSQHGVARGRTRAEHHLLGPCGRVLFVVQQPHAPAGVLLAERRVTAPAGRRRIGQHVNEVSCSYPVPTPPDIEKLDKRYYCTCTSYARPVVAGVWPGRFLRGFGKTYSILRLLFFLFYSGPHDVISFCLHLYTRLRRRRTC